MLQLLLPVAPTCCFSLLLTGALLSAAYKELEDNVQTLEKHFKDMQDVEFTIQDRKLYMLQCRNGKRTGPAAIRIVSVLFLLCDFCCASSLFL